MSDTPVKLPKHDLSAWRMLSALPAPVPEQRPNLDGPRLVIGCDFGDGPDRSVLSIVAMDDDRAWMERSEKKAMEYHARNDVFVAAFNAKWNGRMMVFGDVQDWTIRRTISRLGRTDLFVVQIWSEIKGTAYTFLAHSTVDQMNYPCVAIKRSWECSLENEEQDACWQEAIAEWDNVLSTTNP